MSLPPSDRRLAPAPRAQRVLRGLLGVFLVWHLLTIVGSITRQTPPGKWLRKELTGKLEKRLGIYQTWSMFVPNAPKTSAWLVATGRTPAGDDVVVEVLGGDLPPDRIEWRYRREGKLERNALGKQKGAIRRSWAHWACAREAAAGRPLENILMEKAERRTPKPEVAGDKPRADWRVTTDRLSRQACP